MPMEAITFSQVWAWLAAIFAGFILLTQVVEKLVKIWKSAKAPNDAQDNRLANLEDRMSHVEDCLKKDKKRLDGIDDGNRVTLLSLLALLDHGLDGNNFDQMRHAKEEVQNHLINR